MEQLRLTSIPGSPIFRPMQVSLCYPCIGERSYKGLRYFGGKHAEAGHWRKLTEKQCAGSDRLSEPAHLHTASPVTAAFVFKYSAGAPPNISNIFLKFRFIFVQNIHIGQIRPVISPKNMCLRPVRIEIKVDKPSIFVTIRRSRKRRTPFSLCTQYRELFVRPKTQGTFLGGIQ